MTRAVERFAASALLAAALGAPSPGAAQQSDDVIGRAMRDELARSMKELRLGALERPYFIAYRVTEIRSLDASASYGSLLGSDEDRMRTMGVEVRVGDYAFDNTNFADGGAGLISISFGGVGMSYGGRDLPLDDSYLEIRRRFWRATDADYKAAAETFSAKKAALLNRGRADTLPDFSRETPTQTTDVMPAAEFARRDAESLVRELSAVRELAGLSSSTVGLRVNTMVTRYLNSEGTTFTITRPLFALSVSGATQASDGQPLASAARFYARSVDRLPSREQLTRAVRDLGVRLDSLRNAPTAERYSGPVLFEGRAAAELFSEAFAPALAARRRMEGGDPAMGAMFSSMRGGGSLSDKVGSRVLPEFLSVVDDPTAAAHNGRALLGTYEVDEEGVSGRRKTLVDAGILKTLLSTRTPVEEMPKSSGNERGAGAAPSNMLVRSSASEDDAALRARLLALVTKRGLRYGVIVRELGSSAAFVPEDPMAMFESMRRRGDGRAVLRAYRVYPDGREELIRGARLTGVTPQSFKDIVAVSSTATVLDRAAGGSGGPGGFMMEEMFDEMPFGGMASFVVPSLLFEDLAVTKSSGQLPKPPLSSPPR